MGNYDMAISNAGKEWEEFTVFLEQHYKHGTITPTTGWAHVEMLWDKMRFERNGGICFNNKKYPEAAFWFYQHQMHRLNGIEYSNVALSVYNSGENWTGFDEFLSQQYKKKR